MGEGTVMAKTDGSLQIQIPDETSAGGKIFCNRQYYVVPLEVHTSQLPFSGILVLFPPVRGAYSSSLPTFSFLYASFLFP